MNDSFNVFPHGDTGNDGCHLQPFMSALGLSEPSATEEGRAWAGESPWPSLALVLRGPRGAQLNMPLTTCLPPSHPPPLFLSKGSDGLPLNQFFHVSCSQQASFLFVDVINCT